MAAPRQSRLAARLFSESVVYGVGAVSGQLLNLVLVPIYAHVLGVANYGVVSVLNTTLLLATTFAGFGLQHSFFRAYVGQAATTSERSAALGASVALRLIIGLPTAIAVAVLSGPLAAVLFGDARYSTAVLYLTPIVLFDALQQGPLGYLRAKRDRATYVALSLGRAGIGGVAVVGFIVVSKMGVEGVFIGQAIASVAMAVFGYGLLWRRGVLTVAPQIALMRDMLGYSAPLVPVALAGWVLNVSDRYVITATRGTFDVGVYSLGYSIGMAANLLVVQPFALAWAATKWEMSREDDARTSLAETAHLFAAFGAFVALGLSALGVDVIRVLFPAGSEAARYIVPFSAFGYILYGLYTVASTGLSLVGQTRRLAATMVACGLLNVGLNLAIVPWVGIVGAGVTTVLSYGLLALVTGLQGQRAYAVPLHVGSLILPLGWAALLAAAAVLGPDALPWRLLCVVAYLPVLLPLRSELRSRRLPRSVRRRTADTEEVPDLLPDQR